jgi:hypothetical protein
MKDGIYGKICLEETSHIIRHFSDILMWLFVAQFQIRKQLSEK